MAVVVLCLLVVLAMCLYSRYARGLQKFDGPFLASLTDFWRLFYSYRGTLFPMRDLHERYGSVVRYGPNTLTFSDPQAVKDIFGAGKNWDKSALYPVNAAVARGKWAHTLFSSADQTWHRNVRRAMSGFFTTTTVATFEPLTDSTIEVFLDELETRFGPKDAGGLGKPFEALKWLSYFAFDVMSDMTYSQRHGFVKKGKDVSGIIGWVEKFLDYGFVVGQMPWVDKFLRHNPILMWLERQGLYSGSTFPGVNFALARFGEREQKLELGESDKDRREDLLDKFRSAKQARPEHISNLEVLGLSLSTMIAGSEPTAIVLTAVLYHLLRTPNCYTTLQKELDTRFPPTPSKPPPIPHSTARSLPYLHACIQEAFRMHPPFGLNLERIVPPTGATICNRFVPGGTIVGCSSVIIQRDKVTFGGDVDTYRPERWIENGGNGEKLRGMERAMFLFGAGNHVCLGKNIAAMEIYKLVPSLMRAFEISMANPEKEWSIANWAIPRQKGFEIRIKRRNLK